MAGELLTGDGQIQWRTLLLGASTPYRVNGIEGWFDLPDARGSNDPRPNSHGNYVGQLFSNQRTITVTMHIPEGVNGSLATRLATLRALTARTENPLEEPLAVQWAGTRYVVNARIRRRSVPLEPNYPAGYAQVAVQWEATDPRIYSLTQYTQSLSLAAAASGGLDFDSGGLDFGSGGLDFGPSPSGSLTVTNNGDVDTWPTLEIVGPVTGPHIVFGNTGRVLHFDPTWSILTGQAATVDTRLRTVSIAGISVRQRLITAQWTALTPGANTILYQAAVFDPSTVLRVIWRDAYH